MTATKAARIRAAIDAVTNAVELEDPHDMCEQRITSWMEDGRLVIQVEIRITNANLDYDSGWIWVDAFSVNRLGNRIN